MSRHKFNLAEDQSISGTSEDSLENASMEIKYQVPSAVSTETMSTSDEDNNSAKETSRSWLTESSSESSVNNESYSSKSWSPTSSQSSSESSVSSNDSTSKPSHSGLSKETSYTSIIYNEFLRSLENVPPDQGTSSESTNNRFYTRNKSCFTESHSSSDTSYVFESSTEDEPNFSSFEYTTAGNSNGYAHSTEESPESSPYKDVIPPAQHSDESSNSDVETDVTYKVSSTAVVLSPNLKPNSYHSDISSLQNYNKSKNTDVEYEEPLPASAFTKDMSENGRTTEQSPNKRCSSSKNFSSESIESNFTLHQLLVSSSEEKETYDETYEERMFVPNQSLLTPSNHPSYQVSSLNSSFKEREIVENENSPLLTPSDRALQISSAQNGYLESEIDEIEPPILQTPSDRRESYKTNGNISEELRYFRSSPTSSFNTNSQKEGSRGNTMSTNRGLCSRNEQLKRPRSRGLVSTFKKTEYDGILVRSFSTRDEISSESGDTEDEAPSSCGSSNIRTRSISSSLKSQPRSITSSIRRAHDSFSLTYGQERIGSSRDTSSREWSRSRNPCVSFIEHDVIEEMSTEEEGIFEENGSHFCGFHQDVSPIPHTLPFENQDIEMEVDDIHPVPYEEDSYSSEVEFLRNKTIPAQRSRTLRTFSESDFSLDEDHSLTQYNDLPPDRTPDPLFRPCSWSPSVLSWSTPSGSWYGDEPFPEHFSRLSTPPLSPRDPQLSEDGQNLPWSSDEEQPQLDLSNDHTSESVFQSEQRFSVSDDDMPQGISSPYQAKDESAKYSRCSSDGESMFELGRLEQRRRSDWDRRSIDCLHSSSQRSISPEINRRLNSVASSTEQRLSLESNNESPSYSSIDENIRIPLIEEQPSPAHSDRMTVNTSHLHSSFKQSSIHSYQMLQEQYSQLSSNEETFEALYTPSQPTNAFEEIPDFIFSPLFEDQSEQENNKEPISSSNVKYSITNSQNENKNQALSIDKQNSQVFPHQQSIQSANDNSQNLGNQNSGTNCDFVLSEVSSTSHQRNNSQNTSHSSSSDTDLPYANRSKSLTRSGLSAKQQDSSILKSRRKKLTSLIIQKQSASMITIHESVSAMIHQHSTFSSYNQRTASIVIRQQFESSSTNQSMSTRQRLKSVLGQRSAPTSPSEQSETRDTCQRLVSKTIDQLSETSATSRQSAYTATRQ